MCVCMKQVHVCGIITYNSNTRVKPLYFSVALLMTTHQMLHKYGEYHRRLKVAYYLHVLGLNTFALAVDFLYLPPLVSFLHREPLAGRLANIQTIEREAVTTNIHTSLRFPVKNLDEMAFLAKFPPHVC